MDTEVPTTSSVNPKSSASGVDWTDVALYIIFAFGISWSIWLGLRAVGVAFIIRTAIGMFGPALAALLVRVLRREGFADAGLRLAGRGRRGAWRMYLAAYLVIPALLAAGIVVVLLIGVQHWALTENLHAAARAITVALARQGQSLPRGFTADQLALLNILIQ